MRMEQLKKSGKSMRICVYTSGAGEEVPYRSTLYSEDVPCRAAQIIKRHNASSRYLSKGRNLNLGIPVPGKCPGVGEWPISLSELLQSDVKFLNVATEKDYNGDNKVL